MTGPAIGKNPRSCAVAEAANSVEVFLAAEQPMLARRSPGPVIRGQPGHFPGNPSASGLWLEATEISQDDPAPSRHGQPGDEEHERRPAAGQLLSLGFPENAVNHDPPA